MVIVFFYHLHLEIQKKEYMNNNIPNKINQNLHFKYQIYMN